MPLTNEGVVQELCIGSTPTPLSSAMAERTPDVEEVPGNSGTSSQVSRLAGSSAPGATGTLTAVVTNTGDTVWLANHAPFGGFVTIGCKLTTRSGRLVSDTIGRTYLPADVPPDGKISVDVQLSIPADLGEPGDYEVVVDLVNELSVLVFGPPRRRAGPAGSSRRVLGHSPSVFSLIFASRFLHATGGPEFPIAPAADTFVSRGMSVGTVPVIRMSPGGQSPGNMHPSRAAQLFLRVAGA